MSDDLFVRRLTQFTPDGAGLNRDALLFAAGRASVRPNRGWLVLAAALTVSQLAMLGLFPWPGPAVLPRPVKEAPPDLAAAPAPPAAAEAAQAWEWRERIIATEGNLPAPVPIDLGPSSAPLRAFGAAPLDLLN